MRAYPTIVAGLALLGVAIGQSAAAPSAAPPRFEVASIKANLTRPGPGNYDDTMAPTRLHFQDVDLKTILTLAFGVKRYQLVGADKLTKWSYDINAVAAAPVPRTTMMLMLQQLLVDRFGLRFHQETPAMPSYILTVEKGGIRAQELPASDRAQACAAGAWPTAPEMVRLPDSCKPWTNSPIQASGGSMTLSGHMTIRDLADEITQYGFAGKPVFDRTGIGSLFRLTLRFSSDVNHLGPPGNSTVNQTGIVYPALAGALREQLGLDLEPADVPTRMVHIDAITTTPTPN